MSFLRFLRPQPGRRTFNWLAPVLLGSVAVLAACGGGTSQVTAFMPARVVVLGDENSVIVDNGNADGFKYTINDRTSTGAGKCLVLPTFAQSLIGLYGYATKECNPTGITPKAVIHAVVNATVEDAAKGLAKQIASVSPAIGSSDMVSVMIGANDVIALYEDVRDGRRTSGAAVAEAQRRGTLAAEQINSILGADARAMVITIPDMGLSPYAFAQAKTMASATSVLSTLSYEFNAYLRTRIDSKRFDGRNYGLVLADDIVAAMAKSPTSFLVSPSNAVAAACTTASAVDCLTTTLVTDASTTSHLWADDRHLGPDAHNRIGSQAQSRAANNPF